MPENGLYTPREITEAEIEGGEVAAASLIHDNQKRLAQESVLDAAKGHEEAYRFELDCIESEYDRVCRGI